MYSQEFDKEQSAAEIGLTLPALTIGDVIEEHWSEEDQQQFEQLDDERRWGDHPVKRALALAVVFGGLGFMGMLLLRPQSSSQQQIAQDSQENYLLEENQQLKEQNAELKAEQALNKQLELPSSEAADSKQDEIRDSKLQDETAVKTPPHPELSVPPPVVSRQAPLPLERIPVPTRPIFQASTPLPAPPRFSRPSIPTPVPVPAVSQEARPLPPAVSPPPAVAEVPKAEPPQELIQEEKPEEVLVAGLPKSPQPIVRALPDPAPLKTVLTGTSADIRLDRKIEWSNGRRSSGAITARLTEPLKNGDGSSFLEPGTRLVLRDQGLSKDGEVHLDVVAYQHQGKEKPFPSDALVVTTEDGSPVIAHKQGSRQILTADVGDIIFDAAAEEAKEQVDRSIGGLGGEILSEALDRTKANRGSLSKPPTPERYVLEEDAELVVEVTQPIEVIDESTSVPAEAPPSLNTPELDPVELSAPTSEIVIAPAPAPAPMPLPQAPVPSPAPRFTVYPSLSETEVEQELPTLEQLRAGVIDRDRGTYLVSSREVQQ